MCTIVQEIPQLVVTHLEDLAGKFGISINQDNLLRLKDSWNQKTQVFDQVIQEMGFQLVSRMGKDDPRAALFLSYSGSILRSAPMTMGFREMEYCSIGLRVDYPEKLIHSHSLLKQDVKLEEELRLSNHPVQRTSPIHRIALLNSTSNAEVQDQIQKKTEERIIDYFLEINRKFVS